MTPSELKYNVEKGGDSYFFTRDTMRSFGDTMSNYGCRSATLDGAEVWELYRKRPVKNGLSCSAYFTKDTFDQVFKSRMASNE